MRRSHPRRPSTSPVRPTGTPRSARAAAAAPALRRAAAEALECRTMLTTIVGGDTFEFSANEDTWVRIVAVGNITAEFIGASTDGAGNTFLRDLPGQFFAGPNTGAQSGGGLIFDFDEGILNTDIYRIVVTSSDSTGQLIIAAVEPLDPDDPEERPMEPFEGGAGEFQVINNRNGRLETIDAPGGTGEVLIGSRIAEADENEEIRFIPKLAATTTSPFGPIATGTTLQPGLTVLPGNDLGSFLLGGTLTGTVDVGGSIDRFYCGWLVTGDLSNGSGLSGLPFSPVGGPALPNNFSVAGDVRSLITSASVGTSQGGGVTAANYTYTSGFDAEIGGELEYFRTPDALIGNIHVSNTPGVGFANPGTATEIERHANPFDEIGDAFQAGILIGNTFFNDTRETAQFLGSIGSDDARGFARVTGTLEGTDAGDTVDFYSVALMAGKTHTVRMVGSFVAVYDPDGRRIASNYGRGSGTAFAFKADRPGIYSFRVESLLTTYELSVSNVGNLAVGGVSVTTNLVHEGISATQDPITGDLLTDEPLDQTGFVARNGDWGAIFVGGTATFSAISQTFVPANPNTLDFSGPDNIRVLRGSLRALDAGVIGQLSAAPNLFPSAGPSIEVTRGDVGLVRSRAGFLGINALVAGGDVQLIDGVGTVYVNITAGKGLALLRAADMVTNLASSIRLNANEDGSDGILGLIDVTGDLGTLGAGGPAISTGQGGNVKYIRVGGSVFQDAFFASGGSATRGSGQTFAVGEAVTFRDDGGGRITLTPLGPTVANPGFDPTNPASDPLVGPQLNVITYGIRGSGGVVVIDANVTSTGALTTSNQGLRITGRGASRGRAAAEVGTITVTGFGGTRLANDIDGLPVFPGGSSRRAGQRGPLQLDANGNPVRNGSLGTPIQRYDILIDGSGPVDVYEVFQPGGNVTSITAVENRTSGGDITMIRSNGILDVGRVYARGNIGVPETQAGVDLYSRTNLQIVNAYPFINGQQVGINANQIGEIVSDRSIGHVSTFGGGITRVSANDDGQNTRDVFEGIAGVIRSGGNLGYVDAGEGIASSGTGQGSRAGLYSQGTLYAVTGDNRADIRGDILSATQIRDITLRNGSIIGANIFAITNFNAASVAGADNGVGEGFILAPGIGNVQGRTDSNIRNVTLSGDGGIIGSSFLANGIGNIDVRDGFGIFSTDINNGVTGETNRIRADGYGLRYVTYSGGSRLGSLTADGRGQTISTDEFSRSVRQSETVRADELGERVDPNSGAGLSRFNDIHALLGTSNRRTTIRNVTIGGVMEGVRATGGRSLGSARAHIMRAGDTTLVPEAGTAYPMQLAFADRIDSITTSGPIDGLQVTAGELRRFSPGSDVFRLSMNVAGPLRDVRIRGSLGEGSVIRASGSNGTIGSVQIDDNLDGTIRANRSIESVRVNGRVNGGVIVDDAGSGRTAIRSIRAGRATAGGAFQIDGNVGTLRLDHEFGRAGDTVTINGDVGTITAGAAIKVALTVNGDLGRLEVSNGLEGDLTVRDDLGDLVIKSKTRSNERDTLKANVSVGGSIGTVRVERGNANGNVTAGGNIRSVRVDAGSLRAGKAITSLQGDINTVRISRDLLGRVVADGRFSTVQIGRDVGNGVDVAGVTATDGGDLIVGRDAKAGTDVAVSSRLELLRVLGNVDAGANIRAGTIGTRDLRGRVEGSVAG